MAVSKLTDDEIVYRVNLFMQANPRCTRNQIWKAVGVSDRKLASLGEAGKVQLPRKLLPSESARLARKNSHWGKTRL